MRYRRQRLGNKAAVKLDHLRSVVDVGAGLLVLAQCALRKHLPAGVFHQAERGLVNGGDLIVREHLQRLERALQLAVGARPLGDRFCRGGSGGSAARCAAHRGIRALGHGQSPGGRRCSGSRKSGSQSLDTARRTTGSSPASGGPNRLMSHERNRATAVSLSASG